MLSRFPDNDLEQQRRWFEADELEARIEALEAEQDQEGGRR
jgi:hypothetical protein